MSKTLDRLRVDHRRLRNVLGALTSKGEELQAQGASNNTDHLYCLIDYVMAYPDKVHHPLEEQVFDELVKAPLSPEQLEIVHHIRSQHHDLFLATEDLMTQIDALANTAEVDPFVRQLRQYVELQLKHMQFEEQSVFPMAAECIASEVWEALDQRFGETTDPLFDEADRSYAAIYPYLVVDPEETEPTRSAEPLLRYLSATGVPWKAPAGGDSSAS
ncbi:MAG: hemerythrin domain-containing protein [Pseudomonadales bacterium]